jgi:hypothetical protein
MRCTEARGNFATALRQKERSGVSYMKGIKRGLNKTIAHVESQAETAYSQ